VERLAETVALTAVSGGGGDGYLVLAVVIVVVRGHFVLRGGD
jgi:hypothetical protein